MSSLFWLAIVSLLSNSCTWLMLSSSLLSRFVTCLVEATAASYTSRRILVNVLVLPLLAPFYPLSSAKRSEWYLIMIGLNDQFQRTDLASRVFDGAAVALILLTRDVSWMLDYKCWQLPPRILLNCAPAGWILGPQVFASNSNSCSRHQMVVNRYHFSCTSCSKRRISAWKITAATTKSPSKEIVTKSRCVFEWKTMRWFNLFKNDKNDNKAIS